MSAAEKDRYPMEIPELDRRRGGLATLAGSLVVVVLLFRDPARALSAATTLQGVVFVVVLPVGGILAGLYAVRGGPYSGIGLFVAGSYLAFVGLALGFSLVQVSAILVVGGVVLFGLGVVALLASLRAMWVYLN
ncbi:MAG: hypothetical protein ACI8XM_002420 [Haloarculaceae archaeon]|jgi:hypothetical protein